MKPQVLFRPATHGDLSFIFNSWLKSHRDSDFAKDMGSEVFYENYKHVVRKIMETADTVIACNPEDIDQIFGYVVFSGQVIHYAYVKHCYRRLGIAKRLVSQVVDLSSDDPIVCTHTGKYFRELRQKYRLIYNPFILEKVAA